MSFGQHDTFALCDSMGPNALSVRLAQRPVNGSSIASALHGQPVKVFVYMARHFRHVLELTSLQTLKRPSTTSRGR